jgi:hypothetical protein
VEVGHKPVFHKGVDSISVLLHIFFGCNHPSALLLGIAQGLDQSPITQWVAYIDAMDSTPLGSHNGHLVLAFAMLDWMNDHNGFKNIVEDCLCKAEYLSCRLHAMGIEVFHNEGELMVLIPKTSDKIVNKYTLDCSDRGLT